MTFPRSYNLVVPNLFGTRDQFCGRQFFHRLGVEGVSVSSAPYDEQVHRILLSAGVALLEGLDLSQAAAGRYLLLAAPLRIEGAEASPVRAMLLQRQGIDWDENTWRR